ncbi:MAG: hypothetical protein ABR977_13330 [Candidatus Dormibacteria bacterium]|jgi:hypothetical protein
MLARCMKVRGRRIAVSGVAVVMALAALPPVLTTAGAPTTATGFAGTTATAAAAPPASGEQFAIQVLDSAPIPPGAQVWTAPAPGDLDAVTSVAISGLIDLHELYRVGDPATPDRSGALDSYVFAHLPAGSSSAGGDSGNGPQGATSGFFVSLPLSGPHQYWAQLLYETTAAPGGGYVLRIDAEVVWVPDRSGAEAIPPPAGAELTGYTTLSLMNPSSGPVTVELGQAAGARLAAAVNALPLSPETFCAEDALLFTISFQSPALSAGRAYSVSEDLCGSTVYVSAGGTQLPSLSDTACSLRRLVAGLLPVAATGTREAVDHC